jgi:hypothetical protein
MTGFTSEITDSNRHLPPGSIYSISLLDRWLSVGSTRGTGTGTRRCHFVHITCILIKGILTVHSRTFEGKPRTSHTCYLVMYQETIACAHTLLWVLTNQIGAFPLPRKQMHWPSFHRSLCLKLWLAPHSPWGCLRPGRWTWFSPDSPDLNVSLRFAHYFKWRSA